jgi:hypothetical protein
MNRRVLIGVLGLAAMGMAAFQLIRTQPAPAPAAALNVDPGPPTAAPRTVVEVSPLELSGSLDLLDEAVNRLAVQVNDVTVADAALEAGRYRISLPGKLEVPLSDLNAVRLPNGPGRLRGDASLGANVVFRAYNDANGNAQLDEGEQHVDLSPFRAATDPNLRAFFRYQLVLLSKAASLEETLDSATGAKGYYRYNLTLESGWQFLEGELESNGYAVRAASGSEWDLAKPLPARVGPSAAER